MIGELIVLAVIAVIVNLIPMNETLRTIIYVVVGVAALLLVLPLLGISVPLR